VKFSEIQYFKLFMLLYLESCRHFAHDCLFPCKDVIFFFVSDNPFVTHEQ